MVPTQRDFYKMVILKIPTKWKTFGIMLDIDIERLEGILQDKKSSEDCFLEVYRIGMMELDQQFTWERVLDILYDLNENSLRNKIVDKLQDKILDSVEDEMLTQYKSNEGTMCKFLVTTNILGYCMIIVTVMFEIRTELIVLPDRSMRVFSPKPIQVDRKILTFLLVCPTQ